MMFRRRSEPFYSLVMSDDEFHRLADFNSERARGILHNEATIARMADLQAKYDRARMTRV